MEQEKEVFFTCPYCFQTISMVLDGSQGNQAYIEDCEVCCRPISVSFTVEESINGEVDYRVQAERSQGG